MRIKNEYVVTEIDKILNRLLAQIYPNFDFISGMWVNLENEENRAQMVKGLEKHPGVNHVQVIGKKLEITMKSKEGRSLNR
ncbi:MAG: hypothetical protein IJJ29_07350 [Solobacterium sp.]|nr:hypothetical protein [Solobacterium sp.]